MSITDGRRLPAGDAQRCAAPPAPLRPADRVDVAEGPLSRRDEIDWNHLVRTSGATDVTQLTNWARLRAEVGYRPLYLRAWAGDRLVGGAQVLCRRIPVLGHVGYVPHGPVHAPHADPAQVAHVLAGGLADLASARLRMLVVQPGDGGEPAVAALAAAGFRRSTVAVAPEATLRIDLTGSEDDIRARCSRRLRTWTRQWPGRGVRVREGDLSDVPLLAELTARTAAHHGFRPFSESYLRRMYRELAPRGEAALLVGEVGGRAVAAELFTGLGGVLTARLCGLERTAGTTRLNVANAVTWEGARWARSRGFRYLDLGGVRPESVAAIATGSRDPAAIAGPDRGKLKFGGELHRLPPPLELLAPPIVDRAYRVVRDRPSVRRAVVAASRALRGQRR